MSYELTTFFPITFFPTIFIRRNLELGDSQSNSSPFPLPIPAAEFQSKSRATFKKPSSAGCWRLSLLKSCSRVVQFLVLLIHGMNQLFAWCYKTNPPGSYSNWEIWIPTCIQQRPILLVQWGSARQSQTSLLRLVQQHQSPIDCGFLRELKIVARCRLRGRWLLCSLF